MKKRAAQLLLFIFLPLAVSSTTADMARFESAKEHFRKGMVFFNSMQYLAAAEHFRNAVSVYPDYLTGREYLARSYRLAGRTESALNEWDSLLAIDGKNHSARMKSETIRYRPSMTGDQGNFSDPVLTSTYNSADFGRFSFSHPVDLAVDAEKNLYIASFASGKIVKIDGNGKAVDYFTPALSGKIYGIFIKDNRIAASDFANNIVYILSTNGKKIMQFGGTGSGEGLFHGPQGVSISDDGHIYVVDSGNSRVQKFTADGKFLLSFGTTGTYEGQLSKPTDVVEAAGEVYVTDTGNSRISCFDRHGNFKWNDRIAGLVSPRGISYDGARLFISDSKKGLLIHNISNGADTWFSGGDDEGAFSQLYASAADREGNLYCLDYNRQTVFTFSQAKDIYTNLDLEITSVDTSQFPVVAFFLNIRGRDGRPVYGLNSENFTIVEDGALMRGASTDYLKKVSPSVSMVFCVDRSAPNRGNQKETGWAADFILSSMKVNDRVRILNFSSAVEEANRFDWSRRRAMKALKESQYGEGKRVDSALYTAVENLAPAVNRRGIVLFTDGTIADDSFTQYSMDTVIDYARAHYIPVYVISFGEPEQFYRRLAESTGGALYRAHQADSLKKIYEKIKGAEEYRYVAVYSTFKPRAFQGWWSNVKIEIDYRSRRGVEWGGYFVP